MIRIGEAATVSGISTDTLRYYEKIELITNVQRNDIGVRLYSDKDLSRLRFIKRAQKMRFSLNEIGQLLEFRENPQAARSRVQKLARNKLEETVHHLEELTRLRDELHLLTNLCRASDQGCPILDGLAGNDEPR